MNTLPHLLFVMTDHQRFDTLGMVQCGREVTPNLKRLAQDSTVFERAYNTCPLCVPARTALATGIYPTENGVVYNDWKGSTAGTFTPIHKMLKKAGYYVGHVGVDHIRVTPPMREQGLDFFISREDYHIWAKRQGITTSRDPSDLTWVQEEINGTYHPQRYSNHKVRQWKHPIKAFIDSYFLDRSLDFLRKRPAARPFALFIYLWAPHPPLCVPEPYDSMYDPQKLALPENINTPAQKEPPLRRKGVPAQLAEQVTLEEWKEAWAAHLGLTTMADAILGKLVEELKRQAIYENTCILFTSDHGDHLGQHQMYQKMEMYEEAVHVPLILKLPEPLLPIRGDRKTAISGVVSHLDIWPTLCDIAGIKTDPRDGISLLPLIHGTPPDPNRMVFSQYSGNPGYGTVRRAAVSRQYKYVYDSDFCHELYDLSRDPDEMHNLADDPAYEKILQRFYSACKTYHETHGDHFHWNKEKDL